VCCSALQCVAVCCMCCSELQCVAVCCRVCHCIAVSVVAHEPLSTNTVLLSSLSVLQWVAVSVAASVSVSVAESVIVLRRLSRHEGNF